MNIRARKDPDVRGMFEHLIKKLKENVYTKEEKDDLLVWMKKNPLYTKHIDLVKEMEDLVNQ